MWWILDIWDWFWYYRRGKIKYWVTDFGDTFSCLASNGKLTVYNCYGSTPEHAKEMALYKLNSAMNRDDNDNLTF